jgi:cytochrome c peroxidase
LKIIKAPQIICGAFYCSYSSCYAVFLQLKIMAQKKYLILVMATLLLLYCMYILIPGKNKLQPEPAANLGHYLFFDTRLSYNNTKSCASCHAPEFAFTDGYRKSITASGDNVLHNAPSLINSSQLRHFDLANPRITTLEKQHERPFFNTTPVELGAKGNEALIISRLKADTLYQRLFSQAFPNQPAPFSFKNIIISIAAYVRTLSSAHSAYDRFIAGDSNALSPAAKKGGQLFSSARLNCTACHAGSSFTTATLTGNIDSIYFNTGLYNTGNSNRYPAADNGLSACTGKAADDGKFKTPSLRNVALTAPYMHDGSVTTLNEVIDMYERGGRSIAIGPLAGDGYLNSNKSKLLKGFSISPEEKIQLLAFLYALTDSSILANPAFKNPFVPSPK